MANEREQILNSIGVSLNWQGVDANSTDGRLSSPLTPMLSGYSEYTPVTVRPCTVRKRHAHVERDKQGSREPLRT